MSVRLLIVLLYLICAPALAVAQNLPTAVGSIVICAHGALQTVLIDARGQPLDAPHVCADCVAAAPDDALDAQARGGDFSPLLRAPRTRHPFAMISTKVWIRLHARGPPRLEA